MLRYANAAADSRSCRSAAARACAAACCRRPSADRRRPAAHEPAPRAQRNGAAGARAGGHDGRRVRGRAQRARLLDGPLAAVDRACRPSAAGSRRAPPASSPPATARSRTCCSASRRCSPTAASCAHGRRRGAPPGPTCATSSSAPRARSASSPRSPCEGLPAAGEPQAAVLRVPRLRCRPGSHPPHRARRLAAAGAAALRRDGERRGTSASGRTTSAACCSWSREGPAALAAAEAEACHAVCTGHGGEAVGEAPVAALARRAQPRAALAVASRARLRPRHHRGGERRGIASTTSTARSAPRCARSRA